MEFYKDFLHWCSRYFIDKNINKNEFEATLTIDFKIYEVSYKSLVKNYQNKNYYEVESKSLDNQVFDFLIGKWQIHHINDKSCFFNYDIEF